MHCLSWVCSTLTLVYLGMCSGLGMRLAYSSLRTLLDPRWVPPLGAGTGIYFILLMVVFTCIDRLTSMRPTLAYCEWMRSWPPPGNSALQHNTTPSVTNTMPSVTNTVGQSQTQRNTMPSVTNTTPSVIDTRRENAPCKGRLSGSKPHGSIE